MNNLAQSEVFSLTLVIGTYLASLALYKKARISLLHPLITSIFTIIVVLKAMDIEYEYEKEMALNGSHVLPDFIIHKKDGSIVIWEHAGLLENDEYAQRFSKKLKIYEQAGFTRQNNLIIT